MPYSTFLIEVIRMEDLGWEADLAAHVSTIWVPPVSPIVANLYMEYLEQKALSTAPHPLKFWGRYVDDTFVIHKEANKQSFLQHINSGDPAIRFTVEDNKEDGSIPFLDTIVKPEADCSLSITVYR